MNKPQETMAEFKHRIALLMRNREGGRVYSMIGAARPHPCIVRPRKTKIMLDNPKQHGILES
jgi:hypothetical protein